MEECTAHSAPFQSLNSFKSVNYCTEQVARSLCSPTAHDLLSFRRQVSRYRWFLSANYQSPSLTEQLLSYHLSAAQTPG